MVEGLVEQEEAVEGAVSLQPHALKKKTGKKPPTNKKKKINQKSSKVHIHRTRYFDVDAFFIHDITQLPYQLASSAESFSDRLILEVVNETPYQKPFGQLSSTFVSVDVAIYPLAGSKDS